MTRERQLDRIEGLVAAAREARSETLVLVGEPGVGKSWLCERAAECASGFRVIGTRGVEAESHLGYAGLFDVLSPLLDDGLDCLAPTRADAIRGALRLAPTRVADRLAVAVASLDLLATAAEREPLVAIVDDAHWVDEASLEALRFVARRLDVDRVGFLFAVRRDTEGVFVDSGFETLTVGSLADSDAMQVLEELATSPVDRSVARTVLAGTAGNALALREAVRELSGDQLAGRSPLPDPLPGPAALQAGYAARAARLPDETRLALMLLAVAEAAPSDVFERAMGELALAPAALAPAADAELIRVNTGRPRFEHPLARTAVWHAAELTARRLAHRAIAAAWAEADDPERAAWHLADAAGGPDAGVSIAMVGAARAARTRGAPYAAARAWRRAADLEPDREQGMQLGFEEACDLAHAGRAAEVLEQVDRIIAARPQPPLLADLEMLRGQALVWAGRMHEASTLLADAAVNVKATDLERAVVLLCGTAFACATAGDVPGAVDAATAASQIAEDLGDETVASAQMTLGSVLILAGEGTRGYDLMLRARAQASERREPAPPGPQTALRFGQFACWMEDYDTALVELQRSIVFARSCGHVSELPHALSAMSEFEFRHGDWGAARVHAEEAVRLAADIGQPFNYAHIELARLDAVTGDADGALRHIDALEAFASVSNNGALPIYASAARGLLELSLGDHLRASEHLERTQSLVARAGLDEPNVVQWAGDLVESQCRAGHTRDAEQTLASFADQASRTGRRWALAVAARCRGLLAPPCDIEETFTEAHRLGAEDPSPFERARTELCWGERLRRDGRRVQARSHLEHALGSFEILGAAPWAEKAIRELGSSGAHARRRGHSGGTELTAAESQIASLVAEGKSNKDVAASLFLSPKTVEFHLGRIYRKLGIHSRTQLVRALLLDAPPAGFSGPTRASRT